jgi:hypothetical protein
LFGRLKEDNIERELKEGVDFIKVSTGRVRWQILLNTVTSSGIPSKMGNISTVERFMKF